MGVWGCWDAPGKLAAIQSRVQGVSGKVQGHWGGFPEHACFGVYGLKWPWGVKGAARKSHRWCLGALGTPSRVHRASKEGHVINLELLTILWFSICFRACGELGIPLDCSWGPRHHGRHQEGEQGRQWTCKGALEELQQYPKRGGMLDVRSYHRLLCTGRSPMKLLEVRRSIWLQ